MNKKEYLEMARAAEFAVLEDGYKEKRRLLTPLLSESSLENIDEMYSIARKSGEIERIAAFLSRLDKATEPYVTFFETRGKEPLATEMEQRVRTEKIREKVAQYKSGDKFGVHDIATPLKMSARRVGATLGHYSDEWGIIYDRKSAAYTRR